MTRPTFWRPARAWRRTIGLLALVLLSPTSACSPAPTPSPLTVTVTSVSAEQAEEAEAAAEPFWDSEVPTAGGVVGVLTPSEEGPDEATTTLVSRDAEDGALQWAVAIQPAAAKERLMEMLDTPQGIAARFLTSPTTGYVVVSPDGLFLSLVIHRGAAGSGTATTAASGEEGAEFTDQSAWVLVLDALTGQEVTTVEVSGVVLGQVLTNDALVVQTAQGYYPAAEGMLHVVPLAGGSGDSTTIPSEQWLAGAGADSILLSPRRAGYFCRPDRCGPMTVTRMDSGGAVLGTLTGVIRVYRGGWVERFTDPAAAVDLLVAADTMTDEAFTTAWNALSREVVDVDTGNAVDVTGMRVSPARLPTGPGLLVEQPHPGTEPDQAPTYTPVMWMSAADDGQPHTDNLDTATRD